jgi:vitamin B12 transporter
MSQVVNRDTSKIRLNEVTITATRIPEASGKISRNATVLTHKEIETLPAKDLAGILEYIPELDIRQRGPLGVQADVSIRGGTFDQYAILINGINFNDPQTGHFSLDLPIPLSLVSQIEVLAGSDVKSLGANAFTGAINLVVTKPETSSLHAELTGGRYGYFHAGLDGRIRHAKWWQQGGAVLRKSGGYRPNTDFNTLNGFYQAGLDFHRWNLSFMAGGLGKAFGANSFYTPLFPGQYEKTGSVLGAVQASHHGRLNFVESLYYRRHIDEFTLFRKDAPAWYLSPNYHLSQIAGSKTDVRFLSPLGQTAIGLELRHESIRSTVLGERVEVPDEIPAFPGISLDHAGSRDHFSLSAEHLFETGPVSWNAGLVLHEVVSRRNYFQAYPGIGITYYPGKRLKTYLSFNRAFRLPTFTELYYQSPTNQGNPDLLPETAWHTEIGAEYRNGGFVEKYSVFYRDASQSIDWLRSPDETVWHSGNLGRIVTLGTESGLSWTPFAFPELHRVVDRIDFGYRRYFQHHSLDSLVSQYVLDYLKWKVTSGVTLPIGPAVRLTADLVWQERNGSYATYDANQNIIEIDYKPFMVMDARLSWKHNRFLVFVACSNVFNTTYFDIGGVPQPGTWYTGGMDFNLMGKH